MNSQVETCAWEACRRAPGEHVAEPRRDPPALNMRSAAQASKPGNCTQPCHARRGLPPYLLGQPVIITSACGIIVHPWWSDS